MPGLEFDKYRRLGAYHWKEFERDSIYRRHALRVQSWITEKSGLDVGCGDGLITSLLGPGWQGVDFDSLAVEFAVNYGVNASVGSVYDLTGSFEAVYMGDILEHLDRPDMALNKVAEVTGILYVATPPRRGTALRPYHIQEWTMPELVDFLAASNWKITDPVIMENDRMYGKFVR